MSLADRIPFRKPREIPTDAQVIPFPDKAKQTLYEMFEENDFLGVVETETGDPVVIMSRKSGEPYEFADPPSVGGNFSAANGDVVSLAELGSTSTSPFTSFTRREYNRDLVGIRGLQTYDRMRKSDGSVRGTLRLVKTPVLAARWYMDPATDSVRDKNAADFAWKCLTEYMTYGFMQTLTESLLMADFGYYMFEKVWMEQVINGQNRLVWQKLAPRHPMDVIPGGWRFDAAGGPAGVWMYPSSSDPGVDGRVFIPIDKLLVFTFDKEAGNIEGISVLRSAYKHWYYKEQLYKIDAIQKERHGIGIPVIVLPPGFTADDKAMADQLGRNLRTNERAHVVLPPNWELNFAELRGQPVDAMKSIAHHDAAIRENVLGGFVEASAPTNENTQTLFLKATRFIADIVCETFNRHGIEQLVDYNFKRVGTPILKARRIGESADWRTLSFAVRNMVGSGVIQADDVLEARIREEMDLPPLDVKTARITGNISERITVQAGMDAQGNPIPQQIQTVPGTGVTAPTPTKVLRRPAVPKGSVPQPGTANPSTPRVGQPRQTKPSATPPRGNGGRDASGGK